MLNDLASEIVQFAEDPKQLAEAQAKYAVKLKENSNLMKAFVMDPLGKEAPELHEDPKKMATNFAKLEEFVVEALSKKLLSFMRIKKIHSKQKYV